MLKKALIAASAIATVAVPAVAEAQYYPGYGYGYNQPYYGGGYAPRYNNYGHYYGDRGYYGRSYYGRNSYRYHRCSGTTGTIVGGAAGALIGSQVGRGDYWHRGSGTTGAIVGGAIGALLGREVGRSTC